MKATNVVEALVWSKMEEILSHQPNMCKCEKCRLDIVTYALNRLDPIYVSSHKGELYARAQYLDRDFNTALIVILTEAIAIVSENPKHDKE